MSNEALRSWRVIDSGMVSPAESAALDEAVLDAHILGAVPSTLHFYVRNAPTISLGYFQKASEAADLAACERLGVVLVRRKSGGSAIFTDSGQLIYGLVMAESDLPRERGQSFEVLCSCIARAVSSLGLDASFRSLNDVEVCGKKVSGNAQLRRRGSVLQHGTLVLDTDIQMMDSVLTVDRTKNSGLQKPSERIATLKSLLGRTPSIQDLKARLVGEFGAAFGVRFEPAEFLEEEKASVRRLVRDFYGRTEWNMKF